MCKHCKKRHHRMSGFNMKKLDIGGAVKHGIGVGVGVVAGRYVQSLVLDKIKLSSSMGAIGRIAIGVFAPQFLSGKHSDFVESIGSGVIAGGVNDLIGSKLPGITGAGTGYNVAAQRNLRMAGGGSGYRPGATPGVRGPYGDYRLGQNGGNTTLQTMNPYNTVKDPDVRLGAVG